MECVISLLFASLSLFAYNELRVTLEVASVSWSDAAVAGGTEDKQTFLV
jgi:hypothetical protein